MSDTKITLAEALILRKHLEEKVKTTKSISVNNVFEQKVQRIKVSDGIDEVTANVPKLTLAQVTHEHDFYAKSLRMIDLKIQQANHATEVSVPLAVVSDYVPPEGWGK